MADFGLTTILGVLGTAASAVGTIAGGAAAKTSADYQAAQLEQQGKEEVAASQREAEQARKEKNFILSRQQAVAGASGLGALDETVQDLAGDVVQQGAVNEGMALYGGQERAKGRRAQAAAARLEGKAAQTGSYFSAAGTIMDGIGSFSDGYGQKKKPAGSSSYMYA
ncbi:hypothetical protein LRP31_25440 [Mesorhizobium mediterraneum]|uniref:Uncharacterized protein n=1 Tax=Mesorhizobium mediterraneum TaxID=43617 RepID=A0AB36R8D4_9HYPH|nr:hypothetical protein [Mesorhizobium mediterraneum]PAQ00903.1 hypothetical protein CIT25_17710 [Mesorhizobium mediterraneum]WIW52366.1 hypothetical protein LRP31_25440 [Mesorhizobium mediterraneum]